MECWKCELDKRPDICEVILDFNSIGLAKSKKDKLSTNFHSKGNEKSEIDINNRRSRLV